MTDLVNRLRDLGDRAPERIWIDAERTYSATSFSAGIKYIRADLHDAEVQRLTDALSALIAAAYEAAAQKVHWLWNADGTPIERRVAVETQTAIRALTPADARAALDRRDRRMRAKGMREAAEVCTRLALDDASFIIRSRAEKVDAQ